MLDNFAYAFVNGYANEYSAYYAIGYKYVVWCNLVLDRLAYENNYELTYARQLYKLWRVRYVSAGIEFLLNTPEQLDNVGIFKDHPDALANPQDARDIRIKLIQEMRKEYIPKLEEEKKNMEAFRKSILSNDAN